MSSTFLVWRPGSYEDGICVLQGTEGVENSFEIKEGVSRLAGWPTDASAPMDKSFPKDIGLADSLIGCIHVVISKRVRAFLEGEAVENVEFLPITIVNHKGRIASKDYFILNPLQSVDCIDMGASQAEKDSLDPGMIQGVNQLVLREDAVPKDAMVFRTKYWPGKILIRRDLADRMNEAGLTGLYFIEPAEYTGVE